MRLVIAAWAWLGVAVLMAGTAFAAPELRLAPRFDRPLERPVFLTSSGERGRLYIVEQPGRIRLLDRGQLLDEPFLDLTGRVSFSGEMGLLGLAFHPAFESNGRFFVNYTRAPDGTSVISEFVAIPGAQQADPVERVLLTIDQPFRNHNGGMMAFGPDGLLYIASGDGGSGGDPGDRAQNPFDLLGKILRIDVDGASPYAIPVDNPFAGGGGSPEVFALGLRNPWRFSFDRVTGDLWVGDVGQGRREEIDIVEAGGNYGWRRVEGRLCFEPRQGCRRGQFDAPVVDYGHGRGRCSVTGGYVYRGRKIEDLRGSYVFADFCSGEIFRLDERNRLEVLLDTDLRIVSFGENRAGELFVLALDGSINRLFPARR